MTPSPPGPLDLDGIYRAHRARLAGTARPILRCPAAAEDMAQEAFLRWSLKPATQETPAAHLGLLYRIVKTLSLDALRRDRTRAEAAPALRTLQTEAPDAERIVAAAQDARRAAAALAALPERTRAAFLMRRDEGLPYDAIGKRLGVSAARAHQLAATAMAHVAASLDENPKARP